MLDRILRGHDHERSRQCVGLTSDRDLLFPHRLEQRRLHLGRCPIDFIGQDQVVEQRPRLEVEVAHFGPVDVGAGQVAGQQVRGELDAAEVALQCGGQFLDRGGLGKARRALDQQVAVGEQRDQQAVDQVLLADDVGLQMLAQVAECQMVHPLGQRDSQGVDACIHIVVSVPVDDSCPPAATSVGNML